MVLSGVRLPVQIGAMYGAIWEHYIAGIFLWAYTDSTINIVSFVFQYWEDYWCSCNGLLTFGAI